MASKQTLNKIKTIANFMQNGKGFEVCTKKLEILSAEKGRCIAALTVGPEHLNAGGGLHGGFTATLIDIVSTYALIATEKSSPGVSTDIHVSYVKGAKLGDKIIIDANTVKTGKTLAFLEVVVKKDGTNDVIARGSHTKFIGGGA